MSKRPYFLAIFVLMLSLASAGYSGPGSIKLDFDKTGDVNTEPGFTSFVLSDNGAEINGITVTVSGGINDARRPNPKSGVGPPIYDEEVYRDFVYGIYPSGVTITLGGLGINQECDITIYAFDDNSAPNRVADWAANGDYLLTTDFEGGDTFKWPSPWFGIDYAFGPNTATADEYGRIVLTSTRNPASPAGEDFAFVNAIEVVPTGTYVPPPYAQNPVPFDGTQDIAIDVILEWEKGEYADKHDVYFGTDEADVNDANRSNHLGVLVSQNQSATSYNPPGLLDLDTTYYWRIDEVNDPNIWKGKVWSFSTAPYFIMEDFDSYCNDSELEAVWDTNSTAAEISVETTISIDGNSMKYRYRNNLPPYYSEVSVNISELGIDDPDWLGIGANALALNLCGQVTNPIGEQMYVRLTDGDNPAGAAIVYDNINYAKYEQWNEWNIALTEFNDVNLANVASITIGFGDGSEGDAGTVYLEDITLDTEVAAEPETVNIDLNTTHQTIRGFGGISFNRWSHGLQNDTQVDTAFGTDPGQIGMTILRIDIPPDSGYWGFEVDTAKRAIDNHGAIVFASPWSPPAYMKRYADPNNPLVGGELDPDFYDDYADHLTAFANYMLDHEVSLYAISLQNEPDASVNYESCDWTSTQMRNFLDNNASVIPVKVIAPETMRYRSYWYSVLSSASELDIYGDHLYGGGPASVSKEHWMTEHLNTTYDWTASLGTGKEIHDCMVNNYSAYIWWYIRRYYGPMDEDGSVTKRGYVMSHFAKFVRPGYIRVDATASPASGVYVTAYKSGYNVVIVAVNQNSSSRRVTFSLSGGSVSSYTKYVTSSSNNVANMGSVLSTNILAGNSINTFVGTTISDCDDVLSAGYGLTSDINPDCYVDYEDLKIITDYWLDTNCDLYNDCEGADFEPTDGTVNLFDLSTFTEQWLWCNDPEYENCTANW